MVRAKASRHVRKLGSHQRYRQPVAGPQGRPARSCSRVLLGVFSRSVDCHCNRSSGLGFGQGSGRGGGCHGPCGPLGGSGALAVNAMLVGASKPHEGIVATVVGVGTLLFAAIGVVVQLKDALNTVWEVKDPPISGVWSFIRTYALSLAGILAVGFLLLVSMLMTAALAAVGKRLAPYLPEVSLQLVGFFLSFGIIS